MGYIKAMRGHKEAPQEEKHSMRCHALGCPLVGSMSIANGPFLCSHHGAVEDVKRWPLMTHEIVENEWRWKLLADLQKLHNEGRTGDARTMAAEFWEGVDAHMVPTPDEQAYFDAYIERLRADIGWRVGAVKRQPEPWKRPAGKSGGNLAEQLADADDEIQGVDEKNRIAAERVREYMGDDE